MPSYYVQGLDKLKPGDSVQLEGEEYHHLRVTKRRSKELLLLNSGSGYLATAELTGKFGKSEVLTILQISAVPPPLHSFSIAFALLRNRNDELLVEKCTELGAAAFFPLITEHSVRQVSANTIQRFAKVSLAAIKQCNNPWLPKIHPALSLAESLREISSQGFTPIVCSEAKPEQWLHHLALDVSCKPCFLIGPEGGWSEDEYRQFGHLQQISLGNLVTRAETAAIAVSAQWQAYANQASTTGTAK